MICSCGLQMYKTKKPYNYYSANQWYQDYVCVSCNIIESQRLEMFPIVQGIIKMKESKELYFRRIIRYAHEHSFNDTIDHFNIEEYIYWKALGNTNKGQRLNINLPVVIGITK